MKHTTANEQQFYIVKKDYMQYAYTYYLLQHWKLTPKMTDEVQQFKVFESWK